MRTLLCWIYISHHIAHAEPTKHHHHSHGFFPQARRIIARTTQGCVTHPTTFRAKDAASNNINITRRHSAVYNRPTHGFLTNDVATSAGQQIITLHKIKTKIRRIINNKCHGFKDKIQKTDRKQKRNIFSKMTDHRDEVPIVDEDDPPLFTNSDSIPTVDLAGSITSCEETDTPGYNYDGLPVTMSFRSALDDTNENEEVIDLDEEDGGVDESVEDASRTGTQEASQDVQIYSPSIYATKVDEDKVDGDMMLLEALQNTIIKQKKDRGDDIKARRGILKKRPKSSPTKSPWTSPRLTPKSSPMKNCLKSPGRSPMKSPRIRLSKLQSPARSPKKNKGSPINLNTLDSKDLRHLIEREKERNRQERSVRKKLFKEKEPNPPSGLITIEQLKQGLGLATPPHPHSVPLHSAGPEHVPWRETPNEARTRRAYVENRRKARSINSLNTMEIKTELLEVNKPVPTDDSTDTLIPKLELLEPKLEVGGLVKVKDMESLMKKESDIKTMDDGFSQSEENALSIIGITPQIMPSADPQLTEPDGLCACPSLCRGTDENGRCLSLPPMDPPTAAPTFVIIGPPNYGEHPREDPVQNQNQMITPTGQIGHDLDDTHPPLTQSIISTNRGTTKDHRKALNECNRAVNTGHHLPDFFNQGANIDAIISETIDELAQARATREVLESGDMGSEVGAASLLGTQRALSDRIFALVDRLRVLNYERRNLAVEIQAQQDILDQFVSEGINTTASPSGGPPLDDQDDNGFLSTQNSAQKDTQKANCANQIKWDRFAGFLPNPRTFWRGLEYNYVYNDDAYDWLYDEDEEVEQTHDMDVDEFVGTSPSHSANVSWYCSCERGRCTCNEENRDAHNNYDLNETD